MKSKAANGIFLILLAGLLILRFPVIILPRLGLVPFSGETAMLAFQVGTYLLTAAMILCKRDSLAEYHIDRFALAMLIFAPIALCLNIYLLRGREGVRPGVWINAALAVGLLLALLIWKPNLPKRSVKNTLLWVGIAIAMAVAWSVATDYLIPLRLGVQRVEDASLSDVLSYVFGTFLLQLGNAATLEEPLFRGFLWGFLKGRGWKERWIWLFQAALFMLGHIYYLGSVNYSFFLVVPSGALLLGWLAWRSRSIGASMIAHGVSNALGNGFFSLLRWYTAAG